jgi:hypothetical protein
MKRFYVISVVLLALMYNIPLFAEQPSTHSTSTETRALMLPLIAGFGLHQSTYKSSSPIPCQAQFLSHGIDVCCLATRNKYHEKYH